VKLTRQDGAAFPAGASKLEVCPHWNGPIRSPAAFGRATRVGRRPTRWDSLDTRVWLGVARCPACLTCRSATVFRSARRTGSTESRRCRGVSFTNPFINLAAVPLPRPRRHTVTARRDAAAPDVFAQHLEASIQNQEDSVGFLDLWLALVGPFVATYFRMTGRIRAPHTRRTHRV
jgi:hypothetical protein